MRVAYFDLGFSREEYSLQPTRYGGGGVAARYLKQDPEIDMVIFAPQESFERWVHGVDKGAPVGLNEGHCHAFQRGHPISDALNACSNPHFDLVLHGHTCFAPNRGTYRGPICHWSGFDGKAGHPGNTYILLYHDTFRAQFGERAKYVRIGKPVPTQCPDKSTLAPETPFVFQCSRHDDHMGSINLAKACLEAGIKGVFAGPIHGDYRLRDYIDDKTTFYLGEIDEATKLDLQRRARLVALLLEWPAPFNQTIIEAQGQGTPIYVNRRGPFLETYLNHGYNGWDAALCTLAEAFKAAGEHDYTKPSWSEAREYDVSVMCRTFKQAFTEIVAEWRAEHPSP